MTPAKLQPKNLLALFLLACLFACLSKGSFAQSDDQEKVHRLVEQLTAVKTQEEGSALLNA